MECKQARENLELLVLGGLGAAGQEQVEAHLAECGECRAAEEEYRALVSDIRHGSAGSACRPAFRRGVQSTVAGEIQRERQRLGLRMRVRRAVAAVAALAAVVLLGLSVWLVSHRGSAAGASEIWRRGGAASAPSSGADGVVVEGATMYVLRSGSAGGIVEALDAVSGEVRWESGVPSRGYLAADGARVFCLAPCGPREVALVALAADSGRELWRYAGGRSHRLRPPCRPAPLSRGRLCWTQAGAIHMLRAATGEPVWVKAVGKEGCVSEATVEGENLYVVNETEVHCLATESGHVRWTEALADGPACVARPLAAVGNGRLYIARPRGGRAASLSCMTLAPRQVVWETRVPGARSLLATGEGVYLRGEGILAFDGRTGMALWGRRASGCGPLTFAANLIHFVDSARRGRLIAVDPRTGRMAWEMEGIRSCDAFTQVGGTGYVKTQDGVVRALALGRRRRS